MGLAGVQWREKMQTAIIEQQLKKMLKKKKSITRLLKVIPLADIEKNKKKKMEENIFFVNTLSA